MDTPFIYNKPVTGRHFIGRKAETAILGNLLREGENVVMYEPPKAGKDSLLQQVFFDMKLSTQQFRIASLSLLNIRTINDFCIHLGSSIVKLYGTTPDEYDRLVATHFQGTHFIFDQTAYQDTGIPPSPLGRPQTVCVHRRLPERNAHRRRRPPLPPAARSFQGPHPGRPGGCLLHPVRLAGQCHERDFRAPQILLPPGGKSGPWHLSSGKVVDRALMLGACQLFKSNAFYINTFAAICDSLSKGYMTEPVLLEALSQLLSIHEPRFKATMSDLTTFQVSLLRAVIDGHSKFSSAEVIHRYGLNSSANVRRLKDALCKKEILTFDEEDVPHIIDPLFEYWVTKYYFEIKI